MASRKVAAGAAAVAVLACLIALGLYLRRAPSDAAVLASAASGAAPGLPAAGSGAAPAAEPPSAASSEPSGPGAAVPLGSHQVPQFEADARGNLVVDVHTRDELERLLALNDRDDALALLRQTAATLPPAAYRQATDAFYAYQNYSIALAQAFPPGQQQVTDENAASRQLDTLHALRVQQFGEETAQAYFGDEEATARRLLATMRAQPAGGASFDERAERAPQQTPAANR